MKKQPAQFRRPFIKIIRWSASFLGAALLLATFVAGGFLVGGFLKFTDTIVSYELDQLPDKAAGIVVYTGDSLRIETASRLLQDGKGERLLISGVFPKTSKTSLLTRSGLRAELFDCCVDIDRQAPDTRGNATETGKWVNRHDFDSLIIVTSAYHMPRSILETRRQLPSIALTPHPVAAKHIDANNWYRDRQTFRHLLSEYSKYVAVQIRPILADNTIDSLRASLFGS